MTACSKYAQVDDMFDDVDFYTAPPFPTGDLKTEIFENSDDEDNFLTETSDPGSDSSLLRTPRKR